MIDSLGLVLIGFGCGLAAATLRLRLWRRRREDWADAARYEEFVRRMERMRE